jgi:hypothetical protein
MAITVVETVDPKCEIGQQDQIALSLAHLIMTQGSKSSERLFPLAMHDCSWALTY